MRYESEILYDLMKRDGLLNPSQEQLPYESELKEKYVDEVKGAYPKLIDYRAEWLNYAYENPIGKFPYETLTNVTEATINNVVPYAYKSAILKGRTGYRDIDTGEILETFEEGRNLELVSVQMPVLTTTGKNLFDGHLELGNIEASNGINVNSSTRKRSVNYIPVNGNTQYCVSNNKSCEISIRTYDKNKNYINNLGVVTFFTVPENCKFIRFVAVTVEDVNIQVEQGSKATSYEPYKSIILSTPEDLELRGIGDVQDTLDLTTGEVVQNIYEFTLDGSQKIDNDGDLLYYYLPFGVHNNRSISDKLPSITVSQILDGLIGIAPQNRGNSSRIYIKVNGITTREEMKNFFLNNPTTIQLVLAEPTIKTVDLTSVNQDGVPSTFRPFEGTMHIKTDGTPLKPLFSGEIPVEAITQNIALFIE